MVSNPGNSVELPARIRRDVGEGQSAVWYAGVVEVGMRIRYTVTLDDLIALHRHYVARTMPFVVRVWPLVRWFFPAACLFAVVGVFVTALPAPVKVVTAVPLALIFVMSVVWLLLTWDFCDFMSRMAIGQVRWTDRRGKLRAMLGPHEMELSAYCLILRTEVAEWQFDHLQSVTTESGYTFVSTDMSHHVIPHAAVTEGDPVAFTDALREKVWQEAWD